MITTRDRLIVAMDLSTLESVKCTLDNIGDAVSYYKIGMESFYTWRWKQWESRCRRFR